MLQASSFGEARRLGEVPGVVEHHRWSPDGTRLLLVVAGAQAEQADALGSGTLGPADEEAPRWLPDVESTDDTDEWRRLWVLESATGEARCVSREGLNVWEASWLGNAAAAAIISDAPGEGAWYTASLAVLDLDAGTERVVATSDVQLNFAEGSPDGGTIAVIEALCSDRYVAAGDLVLIDAASGARRTMDAGRWTSPARDGPTTASSRWVWRAWTRWRWTSPRPRGTCGRCGAPPTAWAATSPSGRRCPAAAS